VLSRDTDVCQPVIVPQSPYFLITRLLFSPRYPLLHRFRLFLALVSLFTLFGLGLTSCAQPEAVIPSSPVESPGSDQQVVLRLAMIGDTGIPEPQELVLSTLLAWTKLSPVTTRIIFLGDNIYERGLPSPTDPTRPKAERRLVRQLDIIGQSPATAIFVPGNHDWAKGHADGIEHLRHFQAFIQDSLGDAAHVRPQPGCPGPESLDIGPVRLVFLDTQWWLQKDNRKGNVACPFPDHTSIHAELTRLLSQAGDRPVLVMAHHPLASHGPHGGYSPNPFKAFLKWVFPTNQDLKSTRYAGMASDLKQTLSSHPPLVYVAGHDHSLQILEGGSSAEWLLVSGAGSRRKLTAVGSGHDTLFADSQTGFMTMEFLENGDVYLQVIEAGSTRPIFSKRLK
jgi:hypothetical protein